MAILWWTLGQLICYYCYCLYFLLLKKTLDNTEGAITNGQSRETGNIGYTRRRKTKQKHNTICVGQHNMWTKTNNVNKTRVLLQTTGGKDEPKIAFMR